MATQTTHFNINKPEGTDIFAPLAFDNDAYDLIDSVMYANQNRGITTTSISYSAGVFAIVRNVPTCNFLVFTAPADFTSGNTVEVDGQIKTVRFMDGTAPTTGAWKINYSVLAYVDGAILNIISSTTGDTASLIGDLTDLDTTDKSSCVNAINELVAVDVTKQDSYVVSLNTTDKTVVGAINEVLNSVIPVEYTNITGSAGVTINTKKVMAIGKIVIVNLNIGVSQAGTHHVYGCPAPINVNNEIYVPVSCNVPEYAYQAHMLHSGTIEVKTNTNLSSLLLNAVYVKA